jgi:hypothetical protein
MTVRARPGKHKLKPIPKSECGAPSGSHNDSCIDGSKPVYYKAKTAYAVAQPGDVASMQKEIMEHGPIEVAFYVYGDFESYKGGIYKRSKKDDAPEGGHAVNCQFVVASVGREGLLQDRAGDERVRHRDAACCWVG